MALYDEFLKALEGPFELFVQSKVVNTYLETVGLPITTEVVQEGISREFVILSGYEEERGKWGTLYRDRLVDYLQLGKEVVRAICSPQTYGAMVLTPKFFHGMNIEYRMGLIKTEDKVIIRPVLIEKRKTERIGDSGPYMDFGPYIQILSDLCVIHVGPFINSEIVARFLKKNHFS